MAAAAGVTFGFGIVAAGPEVVWLLRGLAAVLFIAGVGTCLDAIVFTSSWRMTSSALKVPTCRVVTERSSDVTTWSSHSTTEHGRDSR